MKKYYTVLFIFSFFYSNNLLIGQNQFEPNGNFTAATCIEFEEVYQSAIQVASDEDYFKFEVPTEGVIKVEVANIFSNYDIFLYDDDNLFSEIEMTTTPNFASEATLIAKTCTVGTHYLRLKDTPAFGTNFSDQLHSFRVILDTTDIYETNNCNDDAINAFQLPQICIDTFFAAINEFGDQDYFQFTAPLANTIINIDVKNIPSDIDMSIELTNGIDMELAQANSGNPVKT
ncbi:MAG: hypothetical protein ACI9CQ_003015 [Saprospiraceae bacterium]|jgi:hypothetical protein